MAKLWIPPEVEAFVVTYIRSVEELEVLLLLYQGRERPWTAAEINALIRSSESSIQLRLGLLHAAGLVESVSPLGPHRYRGKSEEMDRKVASLALVYKDFRPRLVHLIFNRPSEQILGFSRAFDLKRKP